MFDVWNKGFDKKLTDILMEDGLDRMGYSLIHHPSDLIKTQIQWKSSILVAGMPLVCKLIEEFVKNEKCNLPKSYPRYYKILPILPSTIRTYSSLKR